MSMLSQLDDEPNEVAIQFAAVWKDAPLLTPRMAYEIADTLDFWVDGEIEQWLDMRDRPLHDVPPFDRLDLRVLFDVDSSLSWVKAFALSCSSVSNLLKRGLLPFECPHAYVHELVFVLAIDECERRAVEGEEFSEGAIAIPRRDEDPRDDEDDSSPLVLEGEWEYASDSIDELSKWDGFRLPVSPWDDALPDFLVKHPPSTWFDAPCRRDVVGS